MNGDFEQVIATDIDDVPFVTMLAQVSLGRRDTAVATFEGIERRALGNRHLDHVVVALRAVIDDTPEVGLAALANLISRRAFSDPEGWYYWAHSLVGFGDRAGALDLLRRAVDRGLHCPRALETSPLLEPIRTDPAFEALLARAAIGREEAARSFAAAGGPRLLGISTA
jgi:hypothetical protein